MAVAERADVKTRTLQAFRANIAGKKVRGVRARSFHRNVATQTRMIPSEAILLYGAAMLPRTGATSTWFVL